MTMSGQSKPRNRGYFPSLASITPADPGHIYGPGRDMGPPPLDWPPQPVEIEVNNSRTLPSPSASVSASNTWDSASMLQPHPFGELSYGSSNVSRLQQLPMESQARASAQDPLVQWYTGNDGPWVPKVIPEIVLEDRSQSRQASNRGLVTYIGQYKQPNPSEVGSFQYGAPHSDSGYGTRRSVASVFSADVGDRDQDNQSLAGPASDFQTFPVLTDAFQRDGRTIDLPWGHPTSSPSDSSALICPTCQKQVKTPSELKKHDLRHRKPFVCTVPGCTRTEGFSTTNDLERHTKSKHQGAMPENVSTKMYHCHVVGCKSKDKSWPRLDNFRSHLKRVHGNQLRNNDDEFEGLIRRGEYWERNGLSMDRELTPQRPTLPEPAHTMRSIIHDTLPIHKPEPNWRPFYPEVIEPSQDLIAPKGPQYDHLEFKVAPTNEKSPSEILQKETVQPLEVFRTQGRMYENKIALENVLAPAGQVNPATTKAEPASPQSISRGNAPGKAPRQNAVSASDATLTAVIKTALAGATIADASPNRSFHADSDRNHLPNGRMSSRNPWPAGPNSATGASKGVIDHINTRDAPSPEEVARDSEAQKKAVEVLKVLRDCGYIVQKDPSHSPRPHNLGSAASNRSENQVICPTCKKFKGRPCELKKHMKRHERPYGCTFLVCNKTFGSKNDWKRHENSQHFHLETWRCDVERPEGGACAKVCYRRQTFHDHLVKTHQMSDPDTTKEKLDSCRIGRNCQSRFWCGFCNKLVELKKKGVDAWTERFDHIDDHFMGRHGLPKQGIHDWVPMDSDKPKGEISSPHSLTSPDEDHQAGPSQSAAGSPDGNFHDPKASAGGSPHSSLEEENNAGTKRRRSSSEDSRPTKRPKIDTVIYCCQCSTPHNPRLNQRCTGCPSSPHEFCDNCKVEAVPPQAET